MKKIYVVISVIENGKRYAFADTLRTGENLLTNIGRYKTDTCHLCNTRREAEQLAISWNKIYLEEGTHLYCS
jgi:hypothetical protein